MSGVSQATYIRWNSQLLRGGNTYVAVDRDNRVTYKNNDRSMRLCVETHDWVGTLQGNTQGISVDSVIQRFNDPTIQRFSVRQIYKSTVIAQSSGYHQTNVHF